METIRVLHCNTHGDGWTADSPDLKGWSVASATFGASKQAAEQAIHEQLDGNGARSTGEEPKILHHIACSIAR